MIALGIAIAKFANDTSGLIASLILLGIGASILVYGRYRYFTVMYAMTEEHFVLNTRGADVLVVGIIFGSVMCFLVVSLI